MAYTKELWNKAQTYFEGGKHSLGEISKITGIDKSSLSKKAKIQQWKNGENADYIDAKLKIVEKKSILPMEKINTLDEIADEQIRNKKLINSNAELLASHIPKVLKSLVTKRIDDDGKETELYAVDAKTIRELAEANDKLSITLKVNERFAPKQDISLTNAQQNNENTQIVFKRIGSNE